MATILRNRLEPEGSLRAYLELITPRIVLLLVLTCVTSMIVAAHTSPPVDTVIFTILGGVLSAWGSSAIHQWLGREMDSKMARTPRCPISCGRIEPVNALIFGLALVAWAALILAVFVNWLAAGLAFLAVLYDVILHGLVSRRNIAVSILISGGASAMPVLVGWAAARGMLEPQALILFAIVFYWTLPHSWALAMMKDDAAADVPMMSVGQGERVTRYQILFYAVQLLIISLMPGLLLLLPQRPAMLEGLYLLSAVLLGLGFIWRAVKLIRIADKAAVRVVYKYSSAYLGLLFLAMIADRLLFQGNFG